jgi:hypothetical protein
MTAEAQPLLLPLEGLRVAPRRGWIESFGFDGAFFLYSPLVTLPIAVAPLLIAPQMSILFFFLAFPHYASTFAFYLWDENRERHATRWFAFFAGPVIIALCYGALFYFEVPRIIQLVLFIWNIWHVGRQSCGIASIYRHRGGVMDNSAKRATNFAIIASNFAFAFFNIDTHPQFGPFLQDFSVRATPLLQSILAVTALVALVGLGKSLHQRMKNGQKPIAAELIFIATSIAIFHPYLWVRSSGMATAMMLLPHYLQYLGIVWLLHRRRFRTAEGSVSQNVLQKVSTNIPLLFVILIGVGASFAVSSFVLHHTHHDSLFETMYLLLAFEHFYLDGLFWAFKDPSVRKSIGPWLTRYDPVPVTTA